MDTLAPVRDPGHAGRGVPIDTDRFGGLNAQPRPHRHAHNRGPIALTAAEIRRLFNALIVTPLRALASSPLRTMTHAQRWSDRRRLHQGRARRSHYQRRLAIEFGP
jgi:hypothetical protein